MKRALFYLVVLSLISGDGIAFDSHKNNKSSLSPETKALKFLSREVPRWSRENRCFSCHNNGDAARAIYLAKEKSFKISAETLKDTNRWLEQPNQWKHNGGEGEFSDKKLAQIQFAAALVKAIAAEQIDSRPALEQAAAQLVIYQQKNGSWQIDLPGSVGSPATYGTTLATHIARKIVLFANKKRFTESIAKADRWLRTAPINNTLAAGAVLLALQDSQDHQAVNQKRMALNLLQKGQSPDGGWGPFSSSPSEVFDTAVAVLALESFPKTAEIKKRILKGRSYLIDRQQSDGSWIETTRPSGNESYAQRLSTSGWATQALLISMKKKD